MNPKTIVVFHYHWLPGGVRSAIEKSLAALNEAGFLEGLNIHLVTGDMHKSKKGGAGGGYENKHIDNFRSKFSAANFNLKITEDSRLNYAYEPWPDEKTFRSEESDLADFLLSFADEETLFWLHNVNLCKNPLVTAAWLKAARLSEKRGRPHGYLIHIHDLAECGRLENILRAKQCWGSGGISEIYPNIANSGFAVLSEADKKKLIDSGVDEGRIFHIPNVISQNLVSSKNYKSKKAVSELIYGYAHDNGYTFNKDPKVQWWLLPIRLIRRKNILEALALSAISTESPQLLLTLYANSQSEIPYADKVNETVKKYNLPMVIAFGKALIDDSEELTFDELMQCADAVVTTSLLEGFGYAFSDPVLKNRPLIGRNLHDATVDLESAGFPASELYDKFLIPVSEKALSRKDINRLKASGQKFAEKYRRLLGISQSQYKKFISDIENIFGSEAVDFGLLDLESQLKIIQNLSDKSFLKEIRNLNPDLPKLIQFKTDLAGSLTDNFGPKKNAICINEAFNKVFELSAVPVSTEDISQKLLDKFFTPRYQRPLYSGW